MITVHHLENSRSHRVLWLLEELGVPYEVRRYARQAGSQLAPPELLAVHPLGKSPVITDGDLTLAESAAILEYLVDRHEAAGLAPSRATPARTRYTYWMHYAEGSLMPVLFLGLVVGRIRASPAPFFVKPIIGQVADKLAAYVQPQLARHLAYVESELAARGPWLAGPSFTAADIQMSYPLLAATARGPAGDHPRIAAYLETLRARPAYARAEARGGTLEIVS